MDCSHTITTFIQCIVIVREEWIAAIQSVSENLEGMEVDDGAMQMDEGFPEGKSKKRTKVRCYKSYRSFNLSRYLLHDHLPS